MNATTNISKEEFLNKVESAIKALDDVPHYNRRYLIDDVLLDKLFEIAYNSIYNSIPIEWIERWLNNIANNERYKNEYVELTEEVKRIVYRQTVIIKIPCISDMLEDWEKENEINRRG